MSVVGHECFDGQRFAENSPVFAIEVAEVGVEEVEAVGAGGIVEVFDFGLAGEDSGEIVVHCASGLYGVSVGWRGGWEGKNGFGTEE